MYSKFPRQPARPSMDSTQLRQEHAALDQRLQELGRLRSLSPEEQYEKMVIKKRKLAIKDMLAQHQ